MRMDLYEIFIRNFPFIIREKQKVISLLSDCNNKIIEKKDDKNNLIGVSVINKNTIYMLCVDKKYRHNGLGTFLLNESEKHILNSGYKEIQIGVGDDYIMPGIPMKTKPYIEKLKEDLIYKNVTNEAFEFFKKRGYVHSWKDANCFDMRVNLKETDFPNESIGDVIDGIEYRFATVNDIPNIIKCTDDAYKDFSKYYENINLYKNNSKEKVLIATKNNEVCGTLIISIEVEAKCLGSVGCTTVSHKYRGKHIGVNLVILGTKYLKSLGLKNGYLGYTYSGLDVMYGYAGYKICIYYSMAKKKFIKNKEMIKKLYATSLINDKETSYRILKDNVNLNNIDIVLKEWNNFLIHKNKNDLTQEIEKLLYEIKSKTDIAVYVYKEPYIKELTKDKIINLTGQSGSGKTYYAKENFNSNEYEIIDTDEVLSEKRFLLSKGLNKKIGTYLRKKYKILPDLGNNFDLIYKEILSYCKDIDKTIVIDCAQFHCIKDVNLLKGKVIVIRTDIDTCYKRTISRWINTHKENNIKYTQNELNEYKNRKKSIFTWYKYTNDFIKQIDKI